MGSPSKDVQCSICYEIISGEKPDDLILCPFCSRAFHFVCIADQCTCSACDERVLWPKTGSEEYLELLECLNPTFPSGDSLFVDLKGFSLTTDYFDEHGFETPIKVKEIAGLELQVPHPDFTIDDVVRCCGPDIKVDVINVKEQKDQQMTLEVFGEYFKHKDSRDEVFNLISLEISDTQLVHLVKPPRIVQELSWVSTASHDEIKEQLLYNIDLAETEFYPFGQPQVLRYCLISAKNSFTDFHIDFGGTSVWYHLLWGKKVFYMVEPSDKNLAAFEKWMKLDHRERTRSFFAEYVDKCYKCEFSPGETIFIPAGWIHGVYTPEDSLVFGGNFLHNYGVPMSLKVYELEKRLNIADRFTFPDYELVNFNAAKNFCELVESLRSVGKVPNRFHLRAMKELVPRLKDWYENNSKLRNDLRLAEEPINYKRLLKTLQKITKKSNSVTDLLTMKFNFTQRGDDNGEGDSNFYCATKKRAKAAKQSKVKVEVPLPPSQSSSSGFGDARLSSSVDEVKEEPDGDGDCVDEQDDYDADENESQLSISTASDGLKFDDSTDEDLQMAKIDLKLKAKLIHTLPVQKSSPKKKGASTSSSTSSTNSPDKPKSNRGRKRKIKDEITDEKVLEHSQNGEDSHLNSESTSSVNDGVFGSDAKSSDVTAKQPQNNLVKPIQKKPKKGSATPKQRLGKLLNIKMR